MVDAGRGKQPNGREQGMIPRSIAGALLTIFTTLAVAVATLRAEAGSTGNGTAVAMTHYSFCFGGNRGIVYFSGVIQSAPAIQSPELHVPFDKYISQTYGPLANTGSTCIDSEAMPIALNEKKKREAEFVWKKWKIVETAWAGAGPQ